MIVDWWKIYLSCSLVTDFTIPDNWIGNNIYGDCDTVRFNSKTKPSTLFTKQHPTITLEEGGYSSIALHIC